VVVARDWHDLQFSHPSHGWQTGSMSYIADK
jgi:hypothetical protein